VKGRCSAPANYEILEHTADLRIEVRGKDVAELLARCAGALADLLYDPAPVRAAIRRRVRLDEGNLEGLLVRWLNELIYLREVKEFLWKRIEVETDGPSSLQAVLAGERFDPARHSPRTGLKAATYYQLGIERGAEGWIARILFDV